ncbi:hypothetical protein Tsp_00921 [Trichinella spiralis]|uniref:hypothetical protein n=1 Tax=Trichinella spiralis TaxID=6334 RepID=UPI0001EFB6C5|nr:hypothetical protein Tsp_00921 [Trichinella spiralis]
MSTGEVERALVSVAVCLFTDKLLRLASGLVDQLTQRCQKNEYKNGQVECEQLTITWTSVASTGAGQQAGQHFQLLQSFDPLNVVKSNQFSLFTIDDDKNSECNETKNVKVRRKLIVKSKQSEMLQFRRSFKADN